MIRFLHVTDDATDIRVMVFVPSFVTTTGGREVLRSAGFGLDATNPPNVIVVDLQSMQSEYDPFAWRDATMRAFHHGISGNIDAVWRLPDGAEFNVRDWRIAMIGGV